MEEAERWEGRGGTSRGSDKVPAKPRGRCVFSTAHVAARPEKFASGALQPPWPPRPGREPRPKPLHPEPQRDGGRLWRDAAGGRRPARAMAARSRRPWLSVVLGLVLGFTAASWLIAPRVAEMNEKKRRGASLCSYYSRAAGPGAAGGAAAAGEQPAAAAVLGGTGVRSSPWELPAAEDGTVSSPAAGGEAEQEEEEEGGEKRSGRPGGSRNGSGDWGGAAGCAKPRNFLYVGVMTAQKYLGSRAVAAQRTWAPSVPGRVEFFSSQGSAAPPGLPPLPVVALPGVDDSYPPQKKSFMMIKYMHDHYLDKYEWFMRADDDVYIKGDRGWPDGWREAGEHRVGFAERGRPVPPGSGGAAGAGRRELSPSPGRQGRAQHGGCGVALLGGGVFTHSGNSHMAE